jgi:AcrR family transcriptional regulator
MTDAARSYHHGDLRSALVDAGLRLAREGGIGAVGLREVTRSVGVTPNAAYRHFTDLRALVLAVAHEAQDRLAEVMREQMDTLARDPDPATRAVQRLRGVGLGYIHFARSEPGWFELAFLTHDGPGEGPPTVRVAERVPPPFRLLMDALDGMVDAGLLDPERRANAEWACWSTVHGFAELARTGPLQGLERTVVDSLAEQVVDTIISGLEP